MGLSRIDIYNMALSCIRVGEPVGDVDDETVRRYLLPQSWEFVLSQLLGRHQWSFATIDRKLAKVEGNRPEGAPLAVEAAAVYRWTWVYPVDCHKLIAVGRLCGDHVDFATKYPWDVQAGEHFARVINTMHDHAHARYVSDAVPEAYWPGAFTNAFVWALPAQITRAINASDSDSEYRLKQAQEAFLVARDADIEEQGRAIPRNGNLIESRDMDGDPPVGDEDLFSLAHAGMGAHPWRLMS